MMFVNYQKCCCCCCCGCCCWWCCYCVHYPTPLLPLHHSRFSLTDASTTAFSLLWIDSIWYVSRLSISSFCLSVISSSCLLVTANSSNAPYLCISSNTRNACLRPMITAASMSCWSFGTVSIIPVNSSRSRLRDWTVWLYTSFASCPAFIKATTNRFLMADGLFLWAWYRFRQNSMNLVEQITGVDASGKIPQGFTVFTRTFDQVADIKIKFVTEHFLDRLNVHEINLVFLCVSSGTKPGASHPVAGSTKSTGMLLHFRPLAENWRSLQRAAGNLRL